MTYIVTFTGAVTFESGNGGQFSGSGRGFNARVAASRAITELCSKWPSFETVKLFDLKGTCVCEAGPVLHRARDRRGAWPGGKKL